MILLFKGISNCISDCMHRLGEYTTHEFREPPNNYSASSDSNSKINRQNNIGVSLELETSLVARRLANNIATTMLL